MHNALQTLRNNISGAYRAITSCINSSTTSTNNRCTISVSNQEQNFLSEVNSIQASSIPLNDRSVVAKTVRNLSPIFFDLSKKLPDRAEFSLSKFIDSYDPKHYLYDNQNIISGAIISVIRQYKDKLDIYALSLINVNPFETENKSVMILELGIYDQFQFAVMDYKTGKIKSATNTAIKKLTHHIDLSNVIKNAESLADFISMMRIELTFAILQEQVNLHTHGSSEVTISPLEGIYDNLSLCIKNSLEDYLSEDKEQFLGFKDATRANQQPIKIIYF